MLRRLIKNLAYKNYRYKNLYLKLCKPSPEMYAEYLKHHNIFYSIGKDCYILPCANITDPAYVKMGNNVMLSSCTLLGHDGSIRMLNIAYGKKLDRVGKIEIGNNVFIGHGAIIMPDVTIGSNVIIGAGSLVTKDVEDGSIVGGIPAKKISTTVAFLEKLEVYTHSLPWSEIIANREGAYDPSIEPQLVAARVKYFYGERL